MTAPAPWLSPTLRRWQGPLAIWALATGAGTLAGPFGTFEALGWAARALYWGGIAAVAVALSLGLHALHRGPLAGTGRAGGLALDGAYALVLGGGVHAVNSLLFPGWGGWADYLWLVGVILAMAVALDLLHWLVGRRAAPAAAAPRPDRAPGLMDRLPPRIRAPLVRIEAQDHYLLIVTTAGRKLLLMRMADAEAMLGGAGLRVHRSHWVARDAVLGLSRQDGRWRLQTSDGAEVPVSRGYRAAVAAENFAAADVTPAG